MGNSSIITVLGLLVIFGIISANLNQRSLESSTDSYGYVKYCTAKDIARTAIRVTLRRIDTLNVLDSQFALNGSLFGGTYVIRGTTRGDTVRLKATAYYIDTSYAINTTLYRTKSNFPSVVFRTALAMDPAPANFSMDQSALIDGRDHDTTTALTAQRSTDAAAITVRTSADSAMIRNSVADPGKNLNGGKDISVDPSAIDLTSFADQLSMNADYNYVATSATRNLLISRTTFGSPNSPVIVYVDGRDNNTVRFTQNCVGYGILLVRGGVTFQGQVRWNGLIITYGGSKVGVTQIGQNAIVLGSSIFIGGPDSKFLLQKGAKILFSSQTLTKAKNIPKLPQQSALRVLDWYE